ncbi:hypothetical protein DES53_109244 [Roseimicrobium gellanilyticum]|uniref:Uncharacterized protein n=1 Tax=Roseimicrobium gellanilyticum TaxID=748857 RepID=A0A366HBX7_9BACT|nr:hypothetical protein DES53_109244 [Roseimicrobium gellanilyticum]
MLRYVRLSTKGRLQQRGWYELPEFTPTRALVKVGRVGGTQRRAAMSTARSITSDEIMVAKLSRFPFAKAS